MATLPQAVVRSSIHISTKSAYEVSYQYVSYLMFGYQDTQSCVSSQESRVAHKCVITGTANSLFSTPCISITTGPISIKFTYFISSLYMRPYIPNLKEISPVVREICVPENWPIFFTFFFFFAPFYKCNFEPTKNTLLMDRFLSNLAHL